MRQGAYVNTQNNYGERPLREAIYNRHHAIAQLLLQYEADLDLTDLHGNTPLLQVGHGPKDLIIMLLNKGADPLY